MPLQVQIKTSLALYELSRPAQKYRKAFADLLEQLEISKVVYSSLCTEAGGSMTASLDEVVAKMARAKVTEGEVEGRRERERIRGEGEGQK